MNPVVKILSGLIGTVNRLLEGIDTRLANSIRQGFFFLIFLLAIGAIVMGYRMGAGSAKRVGIPLAESTNQVFELDIKRLKESAQFNALLDIESVRERERVEVGKRSFPTREGIDVESTERLAEPDALRKKSAPTVDLDNRSRISEIDRTDDKPQHSDVKGLSRREPVFDKGRTPEVVHEHAKPANADKDIRDAKPEQEPQQDLQPQKTKKRALMKMNPSASGRQSDRQPQLLDR